MKITYEDLSTPAVDAVLAREEEEAAGRIGATPGQAGTAEVSLIHKAWFNLMIAGTVGAFAAWAMLEPGIVESAKSTEPSAALVLLFPSVAAFCGLAIGATEGLLARNFGRAAKGAGVGLLVGFAGGFGALIIAGILISVMAPIIVSMIGREALTDIPHHAVQAVLAGILLRSPAWAVVGIAAGIGPGIALKSAKLLKNGVVGGLIGGLIGGVLFDPINFIVSHGTMESGAGSSRAIGICIIGACSGAMIGLVDMLTRDAWLLMTAGPLKGKQFTVYNNPTLIGSSPKCDIYLFKDEAIDPTHAAIHTVRDGFELEDLSASTGVLVNGRKIKRQRLVAGDRIQIGKVELVYAEREKRARA